jgi:hypothetical protein
MHQPMHPDDYQRLRDRARRDALRLREQAIREAHAWVAGVLLRAARRVLRGTGLNAPSPASPSPQKRKTTPCQPSC